MASFTDCERNTSGEYVASVYSALLTSNLDFTAETNTNYLYAAESDLALDNRATYTQEVWIYATDLTQPIYSGIWGARDQDQYGTALQLDHGSYGGVWWWVTNSSGGTWVVGGGATGASLPSLNTWTHFASVQQSGSNKLYMNGTHINTETTASSHSAYNLTIKYRTGPANNFKFLTYFNNVVVPGNAAYTNKKTIEIIKYLPIPIKNIQNVQLQIIGLLRNDIEINDLGLIFRKYRDSNTVRLDE